MFFLSFTVLTLLKNQLKNSKTLFYIVSVIADLFQLVLRFSSSNLANQVSIIRFQNNYVFPNADIGNTFSPFNFVLNFKNSLLFNINSLL